MKSLLSKKLLVGLLSASWLVFSGAGLAADVTPAANPDEKANPAAGTYFEKLRLNTQKFEDVKTGNYLREDYICKAVPSACDKANNQDAEDRWYPALPAYTTWTDDGAPHSHQDWLPAPTTQMSGFTQTQDYKQPQTRLRQEREQAVPSGAFRNIGEPQQENRDNDRTDTRSVTLNILAFVPDGNSFGCSTWLPGVEAVNLNEAFTQTRNCDQNAARDVEYFAEGSLIATSSDLGVVTIQESQPATGARDFITGERADAWSVWIDDGSLYACTPWTPLPDTQPLESAFVQTAECSIDQTRTAQVHNVFESGAETPLRIDTENQTIARQDTQDAIGSEDFINSERIAAWENTWSIVQPQVNTNCGPWSPLPSTVDFGSAFTQTRTCDTVEEDFRDIFDVYKSGTEVLREVEQRVRTVQVQETQSETGARDFVASTYIVDGAWTNQGALYNCPWTPDPDTIDVGVSYTQTATCDRNQLRTITTYNRWASGRSDTVASSRDETRTVKENTSRNQTGTGQPVIQYGTWGGYSTYNTTSCTPWSPSVGSVAFGSSFTQNRTCTYNQERFRSRTNLYPSGRTEALSNERGTRSLTSQAESQPATGTQEQETSTFVTYSSWTNLGGAYSCTWTPLPSAIDIGTSFTQTGACSQDQTRVATTWSRWLSGKTDSQKSTATESRTTAASSTRGSTGTGEPTIEYGAWSSYSTYSVTSCTSWSPSPSTVNYGSSFTQTRSCTYNQERYISRTNVYPSGRREALSDQRGTRALTNQGESRTSTGTNDYVSSTYTTCGGYSVTRGDYSCGGWTPSTSTRSCGSSFQQSRSCSNDESRVCRVMNRWASGRSDTEKSRYNDGRTVSVTRYQNATGTSPTVSGTSYKYTSWSTYWNDHSCTAWTPDTSTKYLGESFTQTRSCKDRQERYRTTETTYTCGGATTTSGSTRQTQDIPDNKSRAATGTADPWVTEAGGRQCDVSTERNRGSATYASGSSWSPTVSSRGTSTSSYTQSRAGIQPREYQCYDTERNAVDGSTRRINVSWENAPDNTYTFTRPVTVSRVGPSNSGSLSCGGYTPSASTKCSGSTFTQSRSCTQLRTYAYNHSVGGSNTVSAPSVSSTQYRYNVAGTKVCADCSGTYTDESSSDYGQDNERTRYWAYPDGGFYEIFQADGMSTQYSGTQKSGYYTGAEISRTGGTFSIRTVWKLCK